MEKQMKKVISIIIFLLSLNSAFAGVFEMNKSNPVKQMLNLCKNFKNSASYLNSPQELRDAWDELSARSCDMQELKLAGLAFTEHERKQYRWAELYNSIEGNQTECARESEEINYQICRYPENRFELARFEGAIDCKEICVDEVRSENQVIYMME